MVLTLQSRAISSSLRGPLELKIKKEKIETFILLESRKAGLGQ